MNKKSDKRDRFEFIMQQVGIPQDVRETFFLDGYIELVVCSSKNRTWTIYLYKETLIPSDIYCSFCAMVMKKYAHIADIRFVVHYGPDINDITLTKEYWPLCAEWVEQQSSSVNGWLRCAKIDLSDKNLAIKLTDKVTLRLAQKRGFDRLVRMFFESYFGRTYNVKLDVLESTSDELEKFARKVVEEDQQVAFDVWAATKKRVAEEKPDPDKLVYGYDIQDPAVPIQQIQEEERRVTIQGVLFGLEKKALKSGSTLYSFSLTDYSDSLSAKVFAKTKEDEKILDLLTDGKWVKLRGKVDYDRFMNPPELCLFVTDAAEILGPSEPADEAEEKRVEFHLHTAMSAMDGVTHVEDYIKQAAKWGHKAIAITDHGVVQSFPEAAKAAKAAGIKLIYGLEANVVNDCVPVVHTEQDLPLADAMYVIFDIETTGLSVVTNKIIEIAGVKMKDGKIVEKFASFVNPHEKIPYNIQQLTNITDEMVIDAPELEEVLLKFTAFVEGTVLVAHNARFDMGFMQANLKKLGMAELTNPVLDTLELARQLFPALKNHRLNTLTNKYKVGLVNHHRAVNDAEALGHVLVGLLKDAAGSGLTNLRDLNKNVGKDLTNIKPFHCCLYAKNPAGKKNLFKLLSLSYTEQFNKIPCIPKSRLAELRNGLIISSGCEKGEFFEAVLFKTEEEAERIAEFYDVLEIQPIEINLHLVEKGLVGSRMELEQANRSVVEIGRRLGKPVIATGNVHYLHPRNRIQRDIIIHGITGFSPLKDQRKPDCHFRTTQEMLRQFAFLGTNTAYEVVVKNTNTLADEIETVDLFPKKPFFPILDNADNEIREKCYNKANHLYGDPLPEIIINRLERELVPISKAGFSTLYLIAERLVKKSNEDGYLVGSRGSVGSSIVAMMLGISEVNPLAPHYLCSNCKTSEWFTDGSISSGFDLSDKPCPNCGATMLGDGQDIPFETFLGFKGDKVPDIDLNFSGEYQSVAHNYTKVLFGDKNVVRAGTIGTVAEKTAYGYVKKYEEDHGKKWRTAEVLRLASGCTGVKRNTGQHPGGIVVVPDYIEAEEITPLQYPADDVKSEWKTTHFDYHAFEENLLKLDILGHSDPTMMRLLQELTGVDPLNIPMNDPKVLSLFSSPDALGVTAVQIRSDVGAYGLPDFGSKFTRQMLSETRPKVFSDLLQISGLSHGTGVWLGNAHKLILNGTCTIKTVIGCRDNIMLYLIYKGMDAGLAFTITESVRKGKGLTDEWMEEMRKINTPEWYIDSCLKIEYMFPRAHAAAYCISAVRTAFYKLYYPIEYYAALFTVDGIEHVDVELFRKGYDAILKRIVEIEEKGFEATTREKNSISVLENALEMTARGYIFQNIDLYRSHYNKFIVYDKSLIPPFSALQGVGENAAKAIKAACENGPFLSIEDFHSGTRTSRTIVQILKEMGCFHGLPESNQLILF
ncbi:PolC-type DNA polymerase III [Paenibacillus ginsengarvi]|nr:PolC-type DNA polymerase III [Paenibacillus ginsengarvi]